MRAKMKTIQLLLIILFLTQTCFPCSCEWLEIENHVQQTNSIFKGLIIEIGDTNTYSTLSTETRNYLDSLNDKEQIDYLKSEKTAFYTVLVAEVWKGYLETDTITIYSHPNEAACGYIFELNTEYIVYADKTGITPLPPWVEEKLDYSRLISKENTFWTNFCTRTTHAVDSEILELRSIGLKKKEKPAPNK